MKIIQYNILEGAQDAPQRLDGLLNWLKRQDAEIVTLNELNGWEPEMAMRVDLSRMSSEPIGRSDVLETKLLS